MIMPALIYLVGAFLILFFRKTDFGKKHLGIAVGVIGLLNILILKKGINYSVNVSNLKLILIHTDRLSLYIGYAFGVIALLGLMYTIYSKNIKLQIYGLLYVAGAFGTVFAGDFITIYLFWEMMALASTVLIWLNKSEDAYWTGVRYIIMHLMGGAILLGGIVLYYFNTGSIALAPVTTGLASTLIMLGVGLNAGFILLHTWLPDAYPKAPWYSTIFMSVFTTKTAVYMLIRTSSGLEFVAYMGAIMALFGGLFALMQGQGRKLLSYHIISQVGYMVAAIGIGSQLAINAASWHLVNNIIYKSILFMGIGAVIYRTGREDLTKMGGLYKTMPITTACVAIAALSITGVPLFAGFTSKSLVFEAVELAHNVPLELMLEVAAVATFLSFIKFTFFGFLKPNDEFGSTAKEAPLLMLIPMVTLSLFALITGFFPNFVARILPYLQELMSHNFFSFATVAGSFHLMIPIAIAYVFANRFFEPHMRKIRDFDFLYSYSGYLIAYFSAAGQYINNILNLSYQSSDRLIAYLSTTGQYIDNFLNSNYQRLIYIPELLSVTLAPFYNTLEKVLDNMFKSTLKLKKPLYKINGYVGKWLLATFIDLWLFYPTLHLKKITLSQQNEYPKSLNILEIPLNSALTFLNSLSRRISQLSNLFDKIIVDGLVNSIAKIIFFLGEKARRLQTGFVQNYALIVVFMVAILIFILSIKEGF